MSDNYINSQVEYESTELGKWKTYLTEESWSHLQSSMRALKSAKDGIPTISLYGKKDWSVVTDYYKFAQDKGITYPEWQVKYELSRESKFGEQGGRAAYSAIKPKLEAYVLNVQHCSRESIPETEGKYAELFLKKRSLTETLQQQKMAGKIEAKAASWSTFNLKKDDPVAQQIAVSFARAGKWIDSFAYIFTYIRKMKDRLFIPIPFCVNLLQAQFHDIMLEAIQKSLNTYMERSPFAFFGDKIGFNNLWKIMSIKSKDLDPSHILYVVRDFKAMDTTMGPEQKIKHYCNKISKAFHLTGKAYDEMVKVMTFSNEIPIFTPDGVIVNKIKGEGSGATVTNQGESFDNEDFDYDLNNRILERCQKANIKIVKIDSYGNGDDGISRYYLYDTSCFEEVKQIIDEEADYVCALYGHSKNEKWDIELGTYGLYCQYEIYQDDKGFHADYPISLGINAIMHPMRNKPKSLWDSDYTDWRIANIASHWYGRQDFETAIDYVDNGLKYGLFGKTKEDFIRIFSKYKKYRALRDSEDDFNISDPDWMDNPDHNPVIIYLAKKRGILLSDLKAH